MTTIRVEWGYYMYYAKQPFHHIDYCMDGQLSTENGRILNPELIEFNGGFGPCYESYIPIEKPNWHWHVSKISRRFGGIRFTVDGDSNTVIRFSTRTIDFTFTLREILEKKVITYHIGQSESFMNVNVLLDGYDPNLDTSEDIAKIANETGRWHKLIYAQEFKGEILRWFRIDWIWISPSKPAEIEIEKPKWSKISDGGHRVLRATFRCIAAVPENSPANNKKLVESFRAEYRQQKPDISKPERYMNGIWEIGQEVILPYSVFLNGNKIWEENFHFTRLRFFPLMDELTFEIPENVFLADKNLLKIEMNSTDGYLLISRMYLEEIHKYDFEILNSPKWVFIKEPFYIKLCFRKNMKLQMELPSGIVCLDELPNEFSTGEYRICFKALEPLVNAEIVFTTESRIQKINIEQVIVAKQEPFPMRVGIETLNISPNSPGLMESIIKELQDTQLGDYIIFRHQELDDISKEKAADLARLCREYGIYHVDDDFQAIRTRVFQRDGGEYYLGAYLSEWDADLFGCRRTLQPEFEWKVKTPPEKRTMKTAQEDYLEFFRHGISMYRGHNDVPIRSIISVIGHSFAYIAGVDIAMAQLNKSNNTLLLADLRGASRAFNKRVYGCYSAEGAHIHPETDMILRMWWLALHLSYVCGASYINDEECLFRNYHGRLYSRNDRFPRLRRDIMRRFNRYVKTHPLKSIPKVKQALLIGQYACDVTDGLEDFYNPPNVWGAYGTKSPEWFYSTPEYGLRYLDVFFPGVWLQSLIQNPERIRRWYTGTPYGELELIPIETNPDILKQFDLLLLLGWNTMNNQIYENLKIYVENGGKLFMSVLHLTTNESRNFLIEMEPLNLFNKGDIMDLFGVKIKGKGKRLNWIQTVDGASLGLNRYYEVNNTVEPLHPIVHIAECEVIDAEVLAVDGVTDSPVLVRKNIGNGSAYLLLTYEYPGNSCLSEFVTSLLHGFAKSVKSSVNLYDPSGYIYYTVRTENDVTRIHLLNTDFTKPGNKQNCMLKLRDIEIPIIIKEGKLSEVVWVDNLVILIEDEKIYIETISKIENGYSVKLHGYGHCEIFVSCLTKKQIKNITFEGKSVNLDKYKVWNRISFDFRYRSVGELFISCC